LYMLEVYNVYEADPAGKPAAHNLNEWAASIMFSAARAQS
jgi:hypothetical protein